MTTSVNYQGNIAVLDLGDGENRFSLSGNTAVERHLDEIQAGSSPALVTTAGGKFYTNGLDLEWLVTQYVRMARYVGGVQSLLLRILTFPLPTVAAVNGHAFGAGAMFAVAHDSRLMRSDRGYLCFPEVDFRLPFSPGMAALIRSKLDHRTAITAMTSGHRYGGTEARAHGLVDRTAPADGVLDTALEVATPLLGKDPDTLGTIKATVFAAAVTALG
ncbi:enoyl-CoA hydratase-related protein [Rhodococcus sp. MSC1_016]|uniref:enoyl-CoA hydratase-related protein n=1 Tax=Rhodococcus sp. MSC1_016 TaxID=2909266 RepID=UPI00202F6A07|nr:enoyl-CoA hydratase-related protein [Rhodococcus sp. MSC1_016]